PPHSTLFPYTTLFRSLVLQGIGVENELPAHGFPVHAAEGIRDLAVAPLKAGDQTLGGLVAGYRASHHFTAQEKKLLQDLAELARSEEHTSELQSLAYL